MGMMGKKGFAVIVGLESDAGYPVPIIHVKDIKAINIQNTGYSCFLIGRIVRMLRL